VFVYSQAPVSSTKAALDRFSVRGYMKLSRTVLYQLAVGRFISSSSTPPAAILASCTTPTAPAGGRVADACHGWQTSEGLLINRCGCRELWVLSLIVNLRHRKSTPILRPSDQQSIHPAIGADSPDSTVRLRRHLLPITV
jgi:hypothetical protein